MPQKLDSRSQELLLEIARQALADAVRGQKPSEIELKSLPEDLQADGAAFVTLTIGGELRGCIGSLEAWRPLAREVQARTADAALHDPRFNPVSPAELNLIDIEVSYLTPPQILQYSRPDELPGMLRPGIDGVVLGLGARKATFLPQVWEQLPSPDAFLRHLCQKAGLPADIWKKQVLDISLYQVQEIR